MGSQVEARAEMLATEVERLREAVSSGGMALFKEWRGRIARPEFAASALNFGHYLALRHHDLRRLQRELMALGLSSLGRAEGRVLATLDAVAANLSALAGGDKVRQPRARPTERQFFRGELRLAANTEEIFGRRHAGRTGHILVTLGAEAADDPALVLSLAEAGADGVRINCAHDGPEVWERIIGHARAAGERTGRRPRILMDIAGPKVRTGAVRLPNTRNRIKVGDRLHLCSALTDGPDAGIDAGFEAALLPAGILDRLKIGDRMSIDDGKLRGRLVERSDGGFVAAIEEGRRRGVKLRPGRGMNFPEVDLGLDPLTEKDRADLGFVAGHADMIGFSFVEKAAHVTELQEALARLRPDWATIPVVAKIETPRALHHLPEIVVEAAGKQPLAIMIARGDLAVEIGFERLAEMQEEILWLCEAAHVPAIWATEVLEGLVKKGQPSRGEMTDAAMAARAEAVMLNKGPNIGVGVAALDHLFRRMSEHQVKKTPTLRALHAWD